MKCDFFRTAFGQLSVTFSFQYIHIDRYLRLINFILLLLLLFISFLRRGHALDRLFFFEIEFLPVVKRVTILSLKAV